MSATTDRIVKIVLIYLDQRGYGRVNKAEYEDLLALAKAGE
jgi:hypothetical protein